MSFQASIVTDKNLDIGCRVFDPATGTWYDGAGWTATEGNAAFTSLEETVISDPYMNRYGGAVAHPVGDYIIEYVNALTGEVIGEDPLVLYRKSGYQKNAAIDNFEFPMVSAADHRTPMIGLTVAGTKSLDGGGTWPALTNGVLGVGNGMYRVNLSVEDTNASIATYRFTASGADPTMITIKFTE